MEVEIYHLLHKDFWTSPWDVYPIHTHRGYFSLCSVSIMRHCTVSFLGQGNNWFHVHAADRKCLHQRSWSRGGMWTHWLWTCGTSIFSSFLLVSGSPTDPPYCALSPIKCFGTDMHVCVCVCKSECVKFLVQTVKRVQTVSSSSTANHKRYTIWTTCTYTRRPAKAEPH